MLDPGQGLPMFDGPELIEMIDGAAVFVVNDYEWSLTLARTGLDEDGVSERVGAVVVTRGGEGSMLRRVGRELGVRLQADRSEIPVVPAELLVDPTGCGDAYRAGLLYALEHELPLETGARMGSLLGSLKIARPGPQSIDLDLDAFRARYEREFRHGF